MSRPIEPKWDLLPNCPEDFFELAGEYTLRDLKRKYNSFIRQFKPEEFPVEFQRIRAAFEELNDALRYQEPPRSQTRKLDLQFDWNIGEAVGENLPQSKNFNEPILEREVPVPNRLNQASDGESQAARSKPESLHERVTGESLSYLYEELKAKTLKTPYDYYAIAVFSDILQKENHAFAYWILEGLKVHSDDPALFELLRQYFTAEHEIDGISELLEATSDVIRSDRFYYLTERAWDSLLKNSTFNTFSQTLNSCEANLLDHEVDHMLVFYIHIMKAAIWKADDEWVNDTFEQIEEHYNRMPFWVEEELEFLYQVKSYREHRTQFLEGGLIRVTIDRAIVGYCTNHELEADRRFLECQHELVLYDEELLREFTGPTEELDSVQILWEKISEDVYDRIDMVLIEDDTITREQHTRRLAFRLLTEGHGSRYKSIDSIISIVVGLGLVGSIPFALYLLLFILESFWMTSLKIIGILFADLVVLILAAIIRDRFARKYYRSWWRFEIMRFYQTEWFPVSDLADDLELLKSIKIGDEEYDGLEYIAGLMRADIGLFFYVSAQRLLNVCH